MSGVTLPSATRHGRARTVDEHLADVLSLGPLGRLVDLAPAHALGRTLTADISSPVQLPGFASSAMDGYAVRCADTPGRLAVVEDVPAGTLPTRALVPGTAARVMTGAPLPAGTEAVVRQEDTDGGTAHVVVRVAVPPGAAVRPAGSDVVAGSTLVTAGQRVGPSQLAALHSAGITSVPVRSQPRVLVISTGSELVPAGTTPGPAQLVDSNRPALLAAVAEAGAEPVDGGCVADDVGALLALLDARAPEVDLVLTSGGVSIGAYDVTKAALAPRGVHFVSVAVQPGKPQAWGRIGATAYLGLPGNPVSSLVGFELFVRPLLGRPRVVHRRRLAAPISGSPPGRRQLLRGRLDSAGTVAQVGGAGSHQLGQLAAADCLISLPEGVTEVGAGAEVDVLDLT